MAATEHGENEYGIICLLPEVEADYQRRLCQIIEHQFNLNSDLSSGAPAHITMKYRFAAADVERVERVLREYSAVQVKTKWTLHGFNFFENDDDFVIFIDVIPSQETREAHSRLLTALRQLEWMQWGPFDHKDHSPKSLSN